MRSSNDISALFAPKLDENVNLWHKLRMESLKWSELVKKQMRKHKVDVDSKDILKIPKPAKKLAKNGHFICLRSSC